VLRPWVRWMLFITGYAPLLVLIAIWRSFDPVGIGALVLAILSVAVLVVTLSKARGFQKQTIEITSVKNGGDAALAYLVAYIVPLATGDLESWKAAASLLILGVVIGAIYIRTDLISINPLVYLFGYGIFLVNTERGESVVLSRVPVRVGTCLVSPYSTNVYVASDGCTVDTGALPHQETRP